MRPINGHEDEDEKQAVYTNLFVYLTLQNFGRNQGGKCIYRRRNRPHFSEEKFIEVGSYVCRVHGSGNVGSLKMKFMHRFLLLQQRWDWGTTKKVAGIYCPWWGTKQRDKRQRKMKQNETFSVPGVNSCIIVSHACLPHFIPMSTYSTSRVFISMGILLVDYSGRGRQRRVNERRGGDNGEICELLNWSGN